jgi:hypothetical protein
MTPRTLTIAAIDVTLGLLGAVSLGLEAIRRELLKEQRRKAKSKGFADQVRQDLERI